jgi:hypothetical protein
MEDEGLIGGRLSTMAWFSRGETAMMCRKRGCRRGWLGRLQAPELGGGHRGGFLPGGRPYRAGTGEGLGGGWSGAGAVLFTVVSMLWLRMELRSTEASCTWLGPWVV